MGKPTMQFIQRYYSNHLKLRIPYYHLRISSPNEHFIPPGMSSQRACHPTGNVITCAFHHRQNISFHQISYLLHILSSTKYVILGLTWPGSGLLKIRTVGGVFKQNNQLSICTSSTESRGKNGENFLESYTKKKFASKDGQKKKGQQGCSQMKK